jgi:hypothetical protein
MMETGMHDLPWDGRDGADRRVAAGVYLTRVATDQGTRSARIINLR